MLLSLILTRALVVMLSSCTNSNVILTAESITLLIVLLICITVSLFNNRLALIDLTI